MPLTKRQREILSFLTAYAEDERLRPELRGDRLAVQL